MATAPALGQPSTRSVLVSATPFVRRHIERHRGHCTVLGRFPAALYVELDQGVVIAVLTTDAVALPIGLVLPTSSAQTPLDDRLEVAVAYGGVRLGGVTIVPARSRSALVERVGTPRAGGIAEALRALIPLFARTTLPPSLVHDLTGSRTAEETRRAVRALLGRGPGLTPAGDDVLCGVLVGGALFDRETGGLRRAVLDELAERPRATTSLARQLLERACHGEAIPECAALGAALCADTPGAVDRTVSRLLTIGHSSGVALAYGLAAACELP